MDVTPFFGDPDLYVGCHLSVTDDAGGFPSSAMGHHNYSSTWMYEGELKQLKQSKQLQFATLPLTQPNSTPNLTQPDTDSLVIRHDDQNSCNVGSHHGTYYVAIYAYPTASTTHTKYTISVVHSGGTTMLTDGEPHDGVVFRNLYDLYTFRMGSESSQVKITISPHYGDPDLYVKTNADPAFPATRTDYQYHSYQDQYHSDEITIPEEDSCSECLLSIAGESSDLMKTRINTLITSSQQPSLRLFWQRLHDPSVD